MRDALHVRASPAKAPYSTHMPNRPPCKAAHAKLRAFLLAELAWTHTGKKEKLRSAENLTMVILEEIPEVLADAI